MKIEEDLQIFTFSRLISGIENENEATKLLCDYWINCGKLNKLMLLRCINERNLNEGLRLKEISYLVHSENCMEHLYKALDGFLVAPYCSSETVALDIDGETNSRVNNLISSLKELNNLNKGQWNSFCNQVAESVAKIESSISVLIGSGKKFHFCTNANAQQIISGNVNYDLKSGVYFVIDRQL